MNDGVGLLHGNRKRRKRSSSPNNSTTDIQRDSSFPTIHLRYSSEKQVEPTSPFASKNVGRDFGGGEGPCRGDKVEDEPMEGAGASSVPHEGGEGKKNSGVGAPEGDGGEGGAAETSGGGRKSVGGDGGGGGGGKRPPHHHRKKKEHGSVDLSTTETEDDFDMAEPSSSVFLPEKRDKWWLHKREFDFHHQGIKKKRSKKHREKRSTHRGKSKVKNSEMTVVGVHPLPLQRSVSRQKARKRWAGVAIRMSAVSKFRQSGQMHLKRVESEVERKRRPTPPPPEPETLTQPEKEASILLVPHKKEEVSTVEEVPKTLEVDQKPPEEKKEHWEFSDSEITSDEEKDNLSAADVFKGQLDSEWLLQGEEIQRHKSQKKINASSSLFLVGKTTDNLPTSNEPDFLSVMLPLYRVMMLCGRFPFKIVRSSDGSPSQFQFVRTSKEYAACVVSFFLFGLSSVFMTRNLIFIFLEPPPYTIYDQVLAIEFDKFWSDAVVLLLWFYFLAISNAAMLIRGNNLAEFLNRWLEALTLIRYNATRGLRRFLAIVYLILFFVSAYNVGDFIVEWGHIRGSRGFIGLLIVDQFQNRMRLSLFSYKFAEYLGLFIDLYYCFCMISTLAFISAHAWAIDNAARRFNLRLGVSLGTLCRKSEDVPFELRKVVRWKKLFAEYLVVASFPKMLGKAFLVTLNALFAFLVCMMVMSLYGLFSTALLTTAKTDNDTEYYNISGIANLREGDFVPVKNRLSAIVAFSKEIYTVGLVWMIAFVVLELLNRPGSTIMSGARFVFRKGFVDCKSLVERRFVASMMFSYAPSVRSVVSPGFPIDKVFISKFLTFAFGVFMTCIQFHPHQLKRDTTLICDVFGACQRVNISWVAKQKPAYWSYVQSNPEQQKSTKPPPVPTEPPRLELPKNVTEVHLTPTCVSEGSLPKEWPEFATENQCNGSNFALVYQPSLFQLNDGRYSRFSTDCGEESVPPSTEKFFDCFGEIVDLSESDECGNYFIPTPDLLGDPQNPEMQVSVLKLEGSEGARVFCCFVYEQLESQAEVCNLPEGSRGRCKKHQTGMEEMEASFLELWRSNGGGVDLAARKRWASCLCQGIGGVPFLSRACENMEKPIAASCSSWEVSQKMCDCENEGDNRHVFDTSALSSVCPREMFVAGDHLRLGLVEVLGGRAKGIVHAHGLSLVDSCPMANRQAPYPRYPPAGSKDKLYDCFGVVVSPVRFKDDCGNLRIATPDSKGVRTLPGLRAMEESRVSDPTNPNVTDVYFVCCWDYRSIHTDITKIRAKRTPADHNDHQEICSNFRQFVKLVCAVRKLRVEYPLSGEIGDDESFRRECEGEGIFKTVDYERNVNWRFWEKCEANARSPCLQDY